MQVDVYKSSGDKSAPIEVSPSVFDKPYNEALIHQIVTACLSNRRAGTHAQKTRAEVSGGGAKPWKQKGGGRARAGTNRSPLWRHGGRAFAAKPVSYAQKINKKMYHRALCSILSQLLRDARLKIIDDLVMEQPKTKTIVNIFNNMGLQKSLIVMSELDKNLYLAARNLPHVEVVDVHTVDPVYLLAHKNVLMTKEALQQLNEALTHE